ncbi:hypothetical protein QL093DRAFT_2276850 [Fusarium oxysporum]|nr:hypothetical protein QL093DRAFT_2276850 [Fusarium oxysporum]
MPKKRNNIKSFKPVSTASPTASTSTNSSGECCSACLLFCAQTCGRTSISPSSTSQSALPAAAPSVPPAIREILQIPDTPAPAPRRLARQRFDGNGRRLPAGPPPPRSWVARNSSDAAHEASSVSQSRLKTRGLEDTCLPGTYLPERGSLIDIVLQKLAYEWAFHRVYNQYHLYFVPNHLKAALIRYVGIASEAGLSKLPRSFGLRMPESWDVSESIPSPPRTLLPTLTHLSLALHPGHASSASWKQLLSLLAYWPEPCLTPRSRLATVSSPQGRYTYGGTNLYSHSLDHDWSEALLVLRMLSKNIYALEFLDLTGCCPWFPALMAETGHDFVNWADHWGKITELRLYTGWTPGVQTAKDVERHIRTMRAGKGRFIVVERDSLDDI